MSALLPCKFPASGKYAPYWIRAWLQLPQCTFELQKHCFRSLCIRSIGVLDNKYIVVDTKRLVCRGPKNASLAKFRRNRPFSSCLLPQRQNESLCETILMKMFFPCTLNLMQIKLVFHMKSFARRLVLKQRQITTRKWAIDLLHNDVKQCFCGSNVHCGSCSHERI